MRDILNIQGEMILPIEWRTPGADFTGCTFSVRIGHPGQPPLIVKESTEPSIQFTVEDMAELDLGSYMYDATVRFPDGRTFNQGGAFIIRPPLEN